jgi:hypothetical protein
LSVFASALWLQDDGVIAGKHRERRVFAAIVGLIPTSRQKVGRLSDYTI